MTAEGGQKEYLQGMKQTRAKVIVVIYMTLGASALLGANLFIPTIITGILQHQHPDWDKDQLVGKASTMKSFMDGFNAVVAFIVLPTLGSLSDVYGRKKILVVCNIGQLIQMATIFASYHFKSLTIMYGSCLFSFSMGSQMCIIAYMADISIDEKDKSKNFGLVFASFMLGSIGGSLVLGYLGKYGLLFICFCLMGLSFANLSFLTVVFKEKSHYYSRRHERVYKFSKGNPFHSLLGLFTVSKYVNALVIVYMIVFIAISDVLTTGVLYTYQRYNWGSLAYGINSAVSSVISIIWQSAGVFLLLKFLAKEYIIITTMLVGAGAHFAMGYATQGWMYTASNMVGAYTAMGFPIIQALISQRVPKEKQGITFGGLSSLSSIATFAGALIDENVFALCVNTKKYIPTCPGTPFYFGAALYFLNALILGVLFAKNPPPKEEAAKEIATNEIEPHETSTLLSVNAE